MEAYRAITEANLARKRVRAPNVPRQGFQCIINHANIIREKISVNPRLKRSWISTLDGLQSLGIHTYMKQ